MEGATSSTAVAGTVLPATDQPATEPGVADAATSKVDEAGGHQQEQQAAATASSKAAEVQPTATEQSKDAAKTTADGRKIYDADELESYVREKTRIAAEKGQKNAIATVKEEKGAEGALERSLMDGDQFQTEIAEKGVQPESFKTGRWYKFLNFSGTCYVYVHNLTRDITAVRPENFTEPTAEELEQERKKGLPLTLVIPAELDKIGSRKKIPLVFCTEETQEKIRTFMSYGRGHVVETGMLKRISEFGMEHARKAIVNAMRYGMYLVIEIPLHICDFRDKVCIRKWEGYFPIELFTFKGCDDNNPVLSKTRNILLCRYYVMTRATWLGIKVLHLGCTVGKCPTRLYKCFVRAWKQAIAAKSKKLALHDNCFFFAWILEKEDLPARISNANKYLLSCLGLESCAASL
ncbi:unnamed protein product [Amoebophrya sp. A120]|nr:unnamed protein product [Amoebophrya sp. A120]|eukprot:GSA120T00024976001.1